MMTVQSISLFDDWADNVKTELQSIGYTFKGENDSEKISVQYYNFLKRVIPPKPRKIKKSDVFSCPPELVTGLSFLETKIRTGEDVFPHLSRKLKKLDEIDYLLYDWGIFHLHLGQNIESDGYISRTGPLLFAYYDNDYFYFLNVMPHGSWSRQEILRTIHRNWPETIDDHRIKDKNIVGLSHNVTDDEIKKLRDKNINVLIEVKPAVIYATPGGGFVASGHSMDVMQQHMNNQSHLEDFEQLIKNNPEAFLKSVYGDDLSFITNNSLNFKLIKLDGKHHLRELNNNLSIELNQ